MEKDDGPPCWFVDNGIVQWPKSFTVPKRTVTHRLLLITQTID